MARGKGLYRRGRIWWIMYAGPDGKTRFESSRSSNHKNAEDLLIQRRKAVQEGKDPTAARKIGSHTFRVLADHYLNCSERQKSHPSKRVIIGKLAEALGNYPLRSFSTRLVEEFQTILIDQPTHHGKKRSPATINRNHATLKHMFTKAVEWEMVEDEVLKKIRRVKLLRENNRRLRYLSVEKCHTLIDASSPHLRPIVITALNTGMRREEILSLEWEKHVDLVHGFILLDRTKNGDRREIPINATLRKTLATIVRRLDSPHVFVDRNGKRFKEVKHSFQSALRRTGIKDFRFHDLRHTFASHLVMAGVDITTVKEILGHKNLSMTLRYSHLAPAHKVAALSVLDSTLTNAPTLQLLDSRAIAPRIGKGKDW